MEKSEILSELKRISASENILEEKRTFRKISNDFRAMLSKEQKQSEEQQLDLEAEVEVDQENEQLNESINLLISELVDAIKNAEQQIENEEKENLKAKEIILKRFQILMQEEENIGKLFNTVKEIREEWKAIGNVPKKKFEEIQKQYSQLNDFFNYNVNIYKELQENDLKKNYSLKNQIILKLKELREEKKIKVMERQIRLLQAEWEEVGPTFNEHWEAIKEEYWAHVKAVYDKIKQHYVDLEEAKLANYESKKELVSKIAEYTKEIPANIKEWEKATEMMNNFQGQWKKIGYAPKEVNDQIWEEFRSYFNTFYDKKAEFYKEQNEVFEDRRNAKKSIIEKANELANFENFKDGTQFVKKLQDQWKKVGHAGGYAENRLWKEFREKVDAFFERKDAYFKEQDAAGTENLKFKEALIKEIEAHVPGEDNKVNIEALRTFSARFAEIGNVPFKKKDEVYKAYKKALDDQYAKIKVSKDQKEKMMFTAKIDMIKGSKNPLNAIRKEKDFIRKQINNLTKEIANFENNMAFFGNSKGADALLKGVKQNIDKAKSKVDELKRKLQSLNKTEKEQLESNEAN